MVYLRRSCLWAGEWLGVNASHPAAQAYYDSRVELLAELGAAHLFIYHLLKVDPL